MMLFGCVSLCRAFFEQVCAIIGGMYTIFSLLDTIVYQGSKIIKKKTNLGKQG